MTTISKAKRPRRKLRQYLVDEKGRRTGIVLSLKEYEELVEAAEQRDDIAHLEETRRVPGEPISLEELEARLRAKGVLR
jgi:transcription elongation GreA/GreB family factor